MKQETDDMMLLQTHNPIPETSKSDWADSDAGRALFSRIEAHLGQVRPAPRQPRWRRPTVTIPIFVVLSATGLLFASAIAGDKVINVAAEEALFNPAAVERELAAQGIQAQVQVVPVNDFLVGKWFHLYFHPRAQVDDETFHLLQSYVGVINGASESVLERCPIGDCARTSLLEIPGSVKGPMTLVVGRQPQPGEEYWAEEIDWDNELAPSGALYCLRLEDKTPTEAGPLLRNLGYEIIWVHEADKTSSEVASPPAGSMITFAFFRGPDVVDVRTAEPAMAERYKAAGGTPSQEHPRSSAPWAPDC
ncbi:MAG TPA: hypothetical protein VNC78_02000 [Actinomycetota bacterium]|nr:hypothetical protein [Actinomycetota bacterium]